MVAWSDVILFWVTTDHSESPSCPAAKSAWFYLKSRQCAIAHICFETSAGNWKCFVWKGFLVKETKARWRCCSCVWVAWAQRVTRAKPKYIFYLRNFLTSLFDKHGFHSLFWIYYLSKYNFIWKVSIPGVQLCDMNLCSFFLLISTPVHTSELFCGEHSQCLLFVKSSRWYGHIAWSSFSTNLNIQNYLCRPLDLVLANLARYPLCNKCIMEYYAANKKTTTETNTKDKDNEIYI